MRTAQIGPDLRLHCDNICSSLLFALLLLLLFFIIRFAYFSFQFSNICYNVSLK